MGKKHPTQGTREQGTARRAAPVASATEIREELDELHETEAERVARLDAMAEEFLDREAAGFGGEEFDIDRAARADRMSRVEDFFADEPRAKSKGDKPPRGTQGSLFAGIESFAKSRSSSGALQYTSHAGGYAGGYALPAKPVQTSASHPLRVDFLPAGLHGRPGRLGMTFAPGKQQMGREADHKRDLAADVARLRALGVDTLVCLIEDHEFDTLKIPGMLAAVEAAGIEILRLPVPDYSVPRDHDAFLTLLDQVLDRLEAGKTVVAHCRGGLGRTGTLVAAVLVALGWTPEAAIKHTRAARGGTVEYKVQENYIRWVDSCLV